jgi:hypothetical protein
MRVGENGQGKVSPLPALADYIAALPQPPRDPHELFTYQNESELTHAPHIGSISYTEHARTRQAYWSQRLTIIANTPNILI